MIKIKPLPSSKNDGFILVAALWILSALAVLVTAFSMFVARSATTLRINDDRVQCEALIVAALELTVYQRSNRVARPTSGSFQFRLAKANVAVNFVDEAARIDLNAAPKALISGLFRVLGADTDAANNYADRVLGWRTSPKAGNDSENYLYRDAGLQYLPRGAPFVHVNELWLVPGLPANMVERALHYLTVFNGNAGVNAFDAAPEVLASLPGMSSDRLSAFLAIRNTVQPDRQAALRAFSGIQASMITDSEAVRISVRVNFDGGFKSASEVVIYSTKDDGAFRILSWLSDIDEGASLNLASIGAK